MSITEEAVLTIADVDVNDGYRVELWQHRRRTDYTPEQAETLAAELIVAAAAARQQFEAFQEATAARMLGTPPLVADAIEAIRSTASFNQQMRAQGLRVDEPTQNLRKDGQ